MLCSIRRCSSRRPSCRVFSSSCLRRSSSCLACSQVRMDSSALRHSAGGAGSWPSGCARAGAIDDGPGGGGGGGWDGVGRLSGGRPRWGVAIERGEPAGRDVCKLPVRPARPGTRPAVEAAADEVEVDAMMTWAGGADRGDSWRLVAG